MSKPITQKDDGAFSAPTDTATLETVNEQLATATSQMEDLGEALLAAQEGKEGEGAVNMDDFDTNAVKFQVAKAKVERLTAQKASLEKVEELSALQVQPQVSDTAMAFSEYLTDTDSPESVMSSSSMEAFRGPDGKAGKGHFFIPFINKDAENTANGLRTDNSNASQTVDSMVVPDVVNALKDYGGMREMSRTISTMNGEDLHIPQANNVDKKGKFVANQGTNADLLQMNNFSRITMKAFSYNSGYIPIPREALADSAINLAGWAEDEIVRMMGRASEEAYTIGVSNPSGITIEGVTQVARVGVTSSSQTGFSHDNLIDLKKAVDPAYRNGGERGTGGRSNMSQMVPGTGYAGYMMSDAAETVLYKLKDTEGRPLWAPSIQAGVPNMINGEPYTINQSMAAPAADAISVLYGQFKHYLIRDVEGVYVYRFWDSQTGLANEIWLLAWSRTDGRCVGPKDSNGKAEAIVALQNAS